MNWCFLVIIAMLSSALHAATSVIPGPYWWREVPNRPSSSPPYSIIGYEAWWHGQTSFSGTVIEAACIIRMDNPWQNFSFTSGGKNPIQRDHYLYETVLTLRLMDCDMENSMHSHGSRVKMMFYQSPYSNETHDNTEIQVIAGDGEIIDSGQFFPASELNLFSREIKYKLRFTLDKKNTENKIITLAVIVSHE